MGTFLALATDCKYQGIKNEEEFKERLKALFHAGGMMSYDYMEIFWKKINLLKPVDYDECGNLDFTYNYVKEESWENAGYSSRYQQVYSNKVGNGIFNRILTAAYILQILYSEGSGVVISDDRLHFMREDYCIAWLNHIFKEQFHLINWDRWKTYLMCLEDDDWFQFDYHIDKFDCFVSIVSNYEVMAVQCGIEKTLEEMVISDDISNVKMLRIMLKKIKSLVNEYKNKNSDDSYRIFMDIIKLHLKDSLEVSKIKDENKLLFLSFIVVFQSVVLPIKVISEIYNLDFWELYHEIKDYPVQRKYEEQPIFTMKTSAFLNVDDDDMLYYWKEDCDFSISKETQKWFEELKKEYLELLKQEIVVENPYQWLIDILEFADIMYYKIFAFTSFFQETIANITNQRYLALWKLFENMCHDPIMMDYGKVVFLEDGVERFNSFKDPKYKELYTNWNTMPYERKFNYARVTLRRYMALVANEELRKKVFGF